MPVGSAAINQSSEMDVERSIHDVLVRARDTLRQAENSDEEMSATSIDTLLGRVSESSTREIENLIDELQTLHDQLKTVRGRLRRDIMDTQA
jgi:hypothetical protein